MPERVMTDSEEPSEAWEEHRRLAEKHRKCEERLAELATDDSPRHLWRRRQEHEKARGVIAAQLMTSPAITIELDTPIAEAARVMQKRTVVFATHDQALATRLGHRTVQLRKGHVMGAGSRLHVVH